MANISKGEKNFRKKIGMSTLELARYIREKVSGRDVSILDIGKPPY